MEKFDVIIIGAGHNGLVCAAYLLKAGYQVLVLEKRSVPGGAATTEEALPETARAKGRVDPEKFLEYSKPHMPNGHLFAYLVAMA